MGRRAVDTGPAFASEAALCAAFVAALPPGWVSYNETAGWDILLVRPFDGFQIGIQAKMRLNAAVLSQAVESGSWNYGTTPGPDCRAVLVPDEVSSTLDVVCGLLGVTVIHVRNNSFYPVLPRDSRGMDLGHWHELAPTKRHDLPNYVPDVAAGARSPIQLTPWKVQAIKIAIVLAHRGHLTRQDFKHVGIDHRRWIQPFQGWLEVKDGAFIAGPRLPDFRAMHPRNYAEIEADAEKWMPPAMQSDLLGRAARLV